MTAPRTRRVFDGAASVVTLAGPGVGGRRVQDEIDVGLCGRTDGVPVHVAVVDLLAYLEAENVAIEREGLLGIGVREERRVNDDVHAAHANRGWAPGLLDS